jgi:hypothetical protein
MKYFIQDYEEGLSIIDSINPGDELVIIRGKDAKIKNKNRDESQKLFEIAFVRNVPIFLVHN